MEIEDIRKELNQLLENIVEHSSRYSDERPIPSLEISFVLAKVNKMQEAMAVLRHLLEEQEKASKQIKAKEKPMVIEEEVKNEEEPPMDPAPTEPIDQEESKPLGERLEQPPIAKLIDALTLNDRYLFANELFNKDMNMFNELVKSIDNSSSINEAKELISKLDWDHENEHVVSFITLVERRFL